MIYRVYMRFDGLPGGQRGAREFGIDYPSLEAARDAKAAYSVWTYGKVLPNRYYIRKVKA